MKSLLLYQSDSVLWKLMKFEQNINVGNKLEILGITFKLIISNLKKKL